MSAVEVGNTVNVHYRGTLEDGSEFDSSYDRGETLAFEVGAGMMIKGFDDAVIGMSVGGTKSIELKPSQAYGDVNPEASEDVSKSNFPDEYQFTVDTRVQGQNQLGESVVGIIDSIQEDTVTINFNHPLAGKSLNFEIELVSINEG